MRAEYWTTTTTTRAVAAAKKMSIILVRIGKRYKKRINKIIFNGKIVAGRNSVNDIDDNEMTRRTNVKWPPTT